MQKTRLCTWSIPALLVCVCLACVPVAAANAAVDAAPSASTQQQGVSTEQTGSSLEAAAAKASSTGRTIAMSLIGLALAVAAIVLAFRRDFKEAAGVFAVGIVAVLLATPAGINLLRDTVNSLFGS
jgi:predicted RND superfamily exporter protein